MSRTKKTREIRWNNFTNFFAFYIFCFLSVNFYLNGKYLNRNSWFFFLACFIIYILIVQYFDYTNFSLSSWTKLRNCWELMNCKSQILRIADGFQWTVRINWNHCWKWKIAGNSNRWEICIWKKAYLLFWWISKWKYISKYLVLSIIMARVLLFRNKDIKHKHNISEQWYYNC